MNPLSILIVDDDRDHADSLGELFSMEGHHVEVAYSGEEAIAAYDRKNFDLGFMDVMMPGKDGVQSFLEIRQRHPGANIYMMSGYSVEQLLRQAADNGALGVLAKPLDQSRVIAAIDSVRPAGIVLVAEDNPEFGPTLRDLVRATSRNCELVTNGKEALERLERGGVEVLILDLNMPLIDGISVYSTLRDQGKAVPTILITGCVDQFKDAISNFPDIETTGILTKPFEPDVLINKLDRLVA